MSWLLTGCSSLRADGLNIPSSTRKVGTMICVKVTSSAAGPGYSNVGLIRVSGTPVDGTQDYVGAAISGSNFPTAQSRTGNVNILVADTGVYFWQSANQDRWMMVLGYLDLDASAADVGVRFGRSVAAALDPATYSFNSGGNVAVLAQTLTRLSIGRPSPETSNGLPFDGTASSVTISGTTMTVAGTVTGAFVVGATVEGPGITPCVISAHGTGGTTGTGGAGTYQISVSQTVASGVAATSTFYAPGVKLAEAYVFKDGLPTVGELQSYLAATASPANHPNIYAYWRGRSSADGLVCPLTGATLVPHGAIASPTVNYDSGDNPGLADPTVPPVELSGGATLDGVTASGGLASLPPSTLTGGATLDGPSAAGTLGVTPGVLTSAVIKRNNGTVAAGVTLDWLTLLVDLTGAFVATKTGVVTNGSGLFSVADAGMTPGTVYRAVWREAGGQRGHGWVAAA